MYELTPYIPSQEEKKRVEAILNEILNKVRRIYSKYNAEIYPVGSTARDTFLPGASDIDIYVLSPNYQDLFEIAKLEFPEGHIKYGELLIWNFPYKGFDVDLVFIPPDYEKRDTLYHTEFMLKHLSPEDRNEVRKAKAFFKSKGLYGAEVGGITGIAIEELVRQYKTLENICRLFLKHGYGELWIQDPVLKKPRNLIASITKNKYRKIQNACREYIDTGSFTYKKYTESDFKLEYKEYKIIECSRRFDRALDYHTSLSICNSSGNQIKNLEKDIKFDCEVYVDDKILIALKTTPKTLSNKKEICIPKELAHAIKKFREKHPNIELYEKDGYICGLVDRKFTDPENKIANLIIEKMNNRGYKCSISKS